MPSTAAALMTTLIVAPTDFYGNLEKLDFFLQCIQNEILLSHIRKSRAGCATIGSAIAAAALKGKYCYLKRFYTE